MPRDKAVATGLRDKPRISIVIPCYNQAHYLQECLTSVLEQTEEQWEAIVVDDASPDQSRIQSVVQTINDPRIALVQHKVNRGLAAARNTGLRQSRGEYYICLDADDKFH